MRKFDLSLRSSRSSYFATFRHQLTILSKTDALDEEKWLNMRSEERFSRNAETDLVCRLLLEKKKTKHVMTHNTAQIVFLRHRGQSVISVLNIDRERIRKLRIS